MQAVYHAWTRCFRGGTAHLTPLSSSKQLKTQPFSLLPKISDLGTSMGRNGSKDGITKKTMRSRLDIKEKLILYNLIKKKHMIINLTDRHFRQSVALGALLA